MSALMDIEGLRVHSIFKLVLDIVLLHISIIVSTITKLLWFYSSQIASAWDASVSNSKDNIATRDSIRINLQFTLIALNHANEILHQTLLLSNTRIISYPDLTLSLEMWDLVKFDFEHGQCQRGPRYGLFFHCAFSYSLLWFWVILSDFAE